MIQEIIIIGSLVILIYFYFFDKKNNTKKEILIAVAISFLWVLLGGIYGYRETNYEILGLNMYAFTAWSAGLIILKKTYDYFNWKNKFILFWIGYIISIIAIEFIFYNYLGVQLVTHYSGIFGINALHAPIHGKIYYLIAGPVYIKLVEILTKPKKSGTSGI